MAVITYYHCPKCRSEIKGLGWKKGKLNNCPNCGIYISDLNKQHLYEFSKWILVCIFFMLLSIPVPVLSVGFSIMALILFLRRRTAKSDKYNSKVEQSDKKSKYNENSHYNVKSSQIDKESHKQLTCPKCDNVFEEPLTRFLSFTKEQNDIVVKNYSKDFQICPKCQTVFNPSAQSKSKTIAILIAIFFGLFTWSYTYKVDYKKFWINLALVFITIGFWIPVSRIWAIINAAVRPKKFYTNFNSSII
jgi:uncharacterized C2H2 Zn-finger protein